VKNYWTIVIIVLVVFITLGLVGLMLYEIFDKLMEAYIQQFNELI
jgi:hypothetical protein